MDVYLYLYNKVIPYFAHRSVMDIANINKALLIPLSIYQSLLGIPLKTKTDSNNDITSIDLFVNNKHVNFLELIKNKNKFLSTYHADNISCFDSYFNFYYLKDYKSFYVLAIKQVHNFNVTKRRYSLSSVVLNHVTDVLLDNFIIYRKYGNNELLIKNNKLIESKQSILLNSIEKPRFKVLATSNPNIGVIDCETYTTKKGHIKIYSLGFKTNLEVKPMMYYIDKSTLDYDKLVLDLINELVRPKYSDINFYCHNLGGYVVIFLLKIISDYNDNHDDKYTIDSIFKDNVIISLTISKMIN